MRLNKGSIFIVVFFVLFFLSFENSDSRTHLENQIINKEIRGLEIKIDSLLRKGDRKKAIEVLSRASSIASNRQLSLKFKLANLYFLDSEYSKALVQLRELLVVDPENIEAMILSGDIYFKRNSYRKALENYSSALDYDNKDTVVRERINYINSIIFKQSIPENNNSKQVHPIVISIEVEKLFFVKNYKKAEELIEKNLKIYPNNPKLLLLKAYSYEKLGHRRKAIKVYKKVLKISPDWLDVYDKLANLYMRAGMIRNAINVYKTAGSIHKTNIDMYLKAAKLYQKKGLFKSSRKFLEKILKKHPNSKLLLSELGELFWKAKQINKSRKYFEKLLQKFPQSHYAMNRLAWFCSMKINCLDKGIRMSRKSLELSPDNPSYLDTLAELHYKKGEFKKSYEYIKKAILIDPKNIYYRLQFKKFKKK